VLDPARLPLSPVKPNKLLVIFIGLFAGLASGAGLAFMSEFMDQSVLDVEDAKLSFPLPLLGAIPRITTQEEITAERSRMMTATVIATISGVILVVAALLIALFRGA
jgi:hypothetical protein